VPHNGIFHGTERVAPAGGAFERVTPRSVIPHGTISLK
jgi:hypothetical protein